MSQFSEAKEIYAEFGVNVGDAVELAMSIPISIHCWQTDDVHGFEVQDGPVDGGGILATGSYPGAAKNLMEVRQDLERVLSLVPGKFRVNLHAIYAETHGQKVDRSELSIEHFRSWSAWGLAHDVNLDFNPTYFAHPHAASGMTLSHPDPAIRAYWIKHGFTCRKIGSELSKLQGTEVVNNHWIPDGTKDSPADRWSPRARLKDSLDELFNVPLEGNIDAVESKLFGLGSEDYVVGSFEFYSQYALQTGRLLCLDMGHFHPTENVADKISSILQFQEKVLLHVSRPVRWDSDHVVLFSDDVKNLFLELKRGNAIHRAIVALDYFDASINRIAAYVIGIRSARKAMLYALLDPTESLQEYEKSGKLAQKLAIMEEAKSLPFSAVWDELCERSDVPIRSNWLKEIETRL